MRYVLIQSFDNHLGKLPFEYLALETELQKEDHVIYEPVICQNHTKQNKN